MKKSRVLFTAMAVALTLGTLPMQAKNAAMDRLNQKVKDLGNCLRGKQKCTMRQKMAIAAAIGAAAIVVAKGAGMRMEQSGRAMQQREAMQRPEERGSLASPAGAIEEGGRQLQRPFDATAATLKRGAVATRAGMQRGAVATRAGVQRGAEALGLGSRTPVGESDDF